MVGFDLSQNRLTAHVETVLIGAQPLHAELTLPNELRGMVLLTDINAFDQHAFQNQFFASVLGNFGFGTLRLNLLTEFETMQEGTACDVPLLCARVIEGVVWLVSRCRMHPLPTGLIGSHSAAAAVLMAAAYETEHVCAVVSLGGKLDLEGPQFARVRAPTLLIAASDDLEVLASNRSALNSLTCTRKLEVVPHSFALTEGSKALDVAAGMSGHWFEKYLIDSTPA
ncbi:MAG: alpha/beta hydrolase [Gammaproteobacteria bacterium]|nr:alpha/beta hydrolase [Gammaproteobacteria bacterium]MBU0788506.1 alpha/beta hydrolase [Gammaproteobacteria bacterium]MBU0815670.1 alpha/beta hydrolase [Gammaproteobacteria bacterium]MBU1788122.1 alpha/beta hydrolase [Gammaproteobacteria bacterium]